jgi:hypothetical protein
VNLKTAQAIGLAATQTIFAQGPLPFPPLLAGEVPGGGGADEAIE